MRNPFYSILQNISYLRHDFTGITVSVPTVILFVLSVCFVAIYLFFLFAFGEKLRKVFKLSFSNTLEQSLVVIAVGHIVFSTGIALLGFFSLLTPAILFIYSAILLFFAFFRFPKKIFINTVHVWQTFFKETFRKNRVETILFFLFVLIVVLRLLLPEINSDAIYYHHDYPQEYIRIHSLMEQPRGTLLYLVTPQLGQMVYIITQLLNLTIAPRMIHLSFYFLDFLVLMLFGLQQAKKQSIAFLLPALLFASSSTVVHLASSGYADSQCLFLWTLSLFMILKKPLSQKNIFLSALLFSGALASKIQVLPILPATLAFIFLSVPKQKIKFIFFFFLISFIFPLLWYVRSFVLTGSFLFPEAGITTIHSILTELLSFSIVKQKLFGFVINYNPFILLSFFVVLVLSLKQKLLNNRLLFALLLLANYALLPLFYYFGRYLLFLFSAFSLTANDLPVSLVKNKLILPLVYTFCFVLFSYYFVSSMLLLPYGFGWADMHAYLSRTLIIDGLSYYDFTNTFSRQINKTDVVGVDINGGAGGFGFLYANFIPRDVHYFITPGESFTRLKQNGVTKLVLKNEDVQTFCMLWKLKQCTPDRYQLLAQYLPAKQYLYKLK